jgi:signal transduction histidine kinase
LRSGLSWWTGVSDNRADIEHRVRTELTTISIAAQLLQRDADASERQKRLAQEIIRATERLEEHLDAWFGADSSE